LCFTPPTAALAGASFGLQAISGLLGFGQQEQNYQRQQQQVEQNAVAALASDQNTQTQILLREGQEQQAYEQRDRSQVIEGAKAQARMSVAAAAGGVEGNSVGNILADVDRTVSDNRGVLETNWRNTAQQLQTQATGATLQTQSRINSVPEPVAPSFLGTGLAIAGQGLRALGPSRGGFAVPGFQDSSVGTS
jgi:hypothetical protein